MPSRAGDVPGFHGRYLRIDVARGAAEAISLSEETLRRYLGGVGLGTHLLLREGGAVVDPLDAAAPVAFVFSPLVGSPLTTSAKFAVVAKSPLTQRINDSLASSGFALAGKRTGYDALVIVGRAERPIILIIDHGHVRLEPADGLWGQTIPDAEQSLGQRYANDYRFAVIGPAGERCVRFATVSHDNRHAGRGGSGAVLGAKNIKAIGVRGDQSCRWHAPTELVRLARELSRRSLGPATAKYRELGTAANLLMLNRLNALPTRNFQDGHFNAAWRLAPEQLARTHDKVRASCAACTIGCEHIYTAKPTNGNVAAGGAPNGDAAGARIEYESLFALGPLCGIDDAAAVLRASSRCDQLGLDTISTGGTVAFAMECAERGILPASWLRFGDAAALDRAIDLIAFRRDIGDLLAQGSRELAARLGRGTDEFAPHVKGLELPGYEPRAMQTMALGLAVGTRGADHNRSGAYEVDLSEHVDRLAVDEEAVPLAIDAENRAAIMDSAILCKFVRHALTDFYDDLAHMLRLVTGWSIDATELKVTAERIVNEKKRFNIRAGWTPTEDTLPSRLLETELPQEPTAAISRERLQRLLRAYNLARGWNAEGWLVEDDSVNPES